MKKAEIKAIVGLLAILILPGCAFQKNTVQIDGAVIEVAEETATDASEADTKQETHEEAQEEVQTETQEETRENANKVIPEKAEAYIPPQTIPGEYASDELMEGEELSEEELQQLQDFFSEVENYGFTLSSYETPEDIDWYYVFNWEGAGIPDCEYSKEALYEFMDIRGYDHDNMYVASEGIYEGLSAISGKDVKAFVEAKTGIQDFDLNNIGFYTYIEREDVLFRFSDPFIYEDAVTCLQGVKKDDRVQVNVSFWDDTRFDRRITLEKTGDADNPYRFLSNRQLWEKEADDIIVIKDSETDETFACSVNNKSNGVILKPVQDNVVCGAVRAWLDENSFSDYSYIVEAVICDVNGDGHKDTVAILVFGDDIVPVLSMGKDDEGWRMVYGAEAKSSVSEWLIENVSDITADNVISYILEHQDEFMEIG